MKKENLIYLVEEHGEFIKNYPVDGGQTESNSGDAEVYKYEGKYYEIIAWRYEAEKSGKQITELKNYEEEE